VALGGRPCGRRKTGGRQKGTPNRATLELKEKLTILGCDPAEGIAKIAQDPQTPLPLKLQAFATLMPYVYPKTRILENAEPEGSRINIGKMTREQALDIARDLVALLSPSMPAAESGQAPKQIESGKCDTECQPTSANGGPDHE
jgi:hypothetical protein